jgi:hypothetical protein
LQHPSSQRDAFWRGYAQATTSRPRLAHITERAEWREPVTLLGSALDAQRKADPAVGRPPGYHFSHVLSRIDRLEALMEAGRAERPARRASRPGSPGSCRIDSTSG